MYSRRFARRIERVRLVQCNCRDMPCCGGVRGPTREIPPRRPATGEFPIARAICPLLALAALRLAGAKMLAEPLVHLSQDRGVKREVHTQRQAGSVVLPEDRQHGGAGQLAIQSVNGPPIAKGADKQRQQAVGTLRDL